MNRQPPIRIGRIDYTNVWPIFHHFPETRFQNRAELVLQVPAELNRAMELGEVHMGPISSFAYGEHAEEYVLLPDLSVSALGKVNSLLLFHKKPIEEVAFGKVSLVNTSATTVNLLKVILERFYGGTPSYVTQPPNLEVMLQDADAALLIGDDAIQAAWQNHGYRVTDLGQEWYKHTGKWMTFAVWAVREDFLQKEPGLVAEIYQAFVDSKTKGLSDPSGMIGQAVATIGGTEDYWSYYFSQLTYDFGEPQWHGLGTFFRMCQEQGLLCKLPPIRIWSENTVLRVTE